MLLLNAAFIDVPQHHMLTTALDLTAAARTAGGKPKAREVSD
jgi:hypothetical protein